MIGRPADPRRLPAAQALQDFLARVEAESNTVAGLVGRDTVLGDELAPLLWVAEALKRHRAVPSRAFRRRAGLALAQADMPQRGATSSYRWFGFGARAGALRLAAAMAAIVLALGGLTVAQASRNPDGWAGRTLAQAWRAAGVLPELWGSPTVELPMEQAPDLLPTPLEGLERPLAPAPLRREAEGQSALPSIAAPAATPGVQLGRKPRAPGSAGSFAVPTAAATSATPQLADARSPATATPFQAAVASPSGATPADGSTRLTPASATALATAPPGSPPTVSAPPGKILEASLGGTVALQGGRPLSNLPVTVFRHDAEGNARWWDAVATTRTDADGRYQLRNLPPGSYKVMAGYFLLFAPRRWYPSAARSAEGQAVVLAGGQTRDDVDLRFGEEEAAPLLIWALLGR